MKVFRFSLNMEVVRPSSSPREIPFEDEKLHILS